MLYFSVFIVFQQPQNFIQICMEIRGEIGLFVQNIQGNEVWYCFVSFLISFCNEELIVGVNSLGLMILCKIKKVAWLSGDSTLKCYITFECSSGNIFSQILGLTEFHFRKATHYLHKKSLWWLFAGLEFILLYMHRNLGYSRSRVSNYSVTWFQVRVLRWSLLKFTSLKIILNYNRKKQQWIIKLSTLRSLTQNSYTKYVGYMDTVP